MPLSLPLARRVAARAAVLLLALSLCSPAFADRITDQARQLMDQKRAREAYALLAPLESQRAGDPEFDYLLGIAALDSGQIERAIFALERVLAVNPNHLQARAEIARAYYLAGEIVNAQQEFNAVKSRNPPPAVQRTIDQYLAALTPHPTRFRGYAEASWGYDTNVNSATWRDQVTFALPGFGPMLGILDPSSRALKDHFHTLALGGALTHSLNDRWSLQGTASYVGRYNNTYDTLDTGSADVSGGARWSEGKHSIVGVFQYQDFRVNDQPFRKMTGGILQWLYRPSPNTELGVFGQFAALRYPGQEPRNTNRSVGGAALSQSFATAGTPSLYISAYGGTEREQDAAFPQLGFNLAGVRIGGQVLPHDRVSVFVAGSEETRRAHGPDPLFGDTRSDRQLDCRIGLTVMMVRNLTLTPQFQRTLNKSNLELYQFSRNVTSVALRYEF